MGNHGTCIYVVLYYAIYVILIHNAVYFTIRRENPV